LISFVSRLGVLVLVAVAIATFFTTSSLGLAAPPSSPILLAAAPPLAVTSPPMLASTAPPTHSSPQASPQMPASSAAPTVAPSPTQAITSSSPSLRLASRTPQPESVGPINATQLALVINTADPLSVKIGAYYAKRRHIPPGNIVRIRFDSNRDELPPDEFTALRKTFSPQVGRRIQAYALTWARPYRVGCMSITSAFAFGYDPKYCASGCNLTRANPYFNSGVAQPYTELGFRPTMSIAAVDFDHARALIDHGVRSDGTHPSGTGYLVIGDDNVRNVRAAEYPLAEKETGNAIDVNVIRGLPLTGRDDVMFYFVGAVTVPALETNRFLPGAVADHLTSFGGMLTDSSQMSSLRWLEAGATGSYGTVVEPCAFPQKFPNVTMLMSYYTAGATLIEAYWKSVEMPGQGIFIGEPLATPFRPR
jgi:uncharacterized protein (TIGR03790 family)